LLLFHDTQWAAAFRRILPRAEGETFLPSAAKLVAARLKASARESLRLVPIIGSKGAPLAEVAAAIAALAGRPLAELESSHGDAGLVARVRPLSALV
jgi:hypothetical protein